MAPTWSLTWADEFDGAAGTTPDPARWNTETGGHGWGNRQLEFATGSNAALDGYGNLVITSNPTAADVNRECWYGRCLFDGARLTTESLFTQQYGRFEIRVALPGGEATWPAFWMLGANRPTVGWPAAGEIDVVEHVGRDGAVVHGVLHGPGYSGGEGIDGATTVLDHTGFHVYRVEWGPDLIVWSVDGVAYHHVARGDVEQWVFDQPMYLLLDVAVGGNLGGEPGALDQQARGTTVDYVRVWQRDDGWG